MYILVILSHANDLKIKDKAVYLLAPLIKKLKDRQFLKRKGLEGNIQEESKEVIGDEEEGFQTSMFVKKAAHYEITSMKGFQIAEELCSISIIIFELLEDQDERSSLQPSLEKKLLDLFSKNYQTYSQKQYKTLGILRNYLKYLYCDLDSQIAHDIQDFNFLLVILQTTTNVAERKIAFEILQILVTKGKYDWLTQRCKETLEEYKYKETTDYGIEEHSTICNLTILLLMDNLSRGNAQDTKTLEVYYKLCADFNKISDYKPTNLDRITNFGFCIGKLGEMTNLRTLSEDQICSDAFDDLITKLMEIIDNKELNMDFRKVCVEEYLMKLYKNTDEYFDHVKYLREQYIEYDQYELHQSIGKSASCLMTKEHLDEYFKDLETSINNKENTLIAKRASIVHLAEFIMNSDLIKEFQGKLTSFQAIFFKYIFDKKEVIQESASNVLTKLYQLGDAETREKLVRNLTRALGGSQTLTHMQEKEEDFELTLEYKPSTEESKKMKTFKELCDIATDIGHNELIYQFLNIHRHLNHYKNIKKAADSLHGILLEDQKVKNDLLKMVPKIFLMTYDYNEEIRDTMKEVMSVLVTSKEEKQIIHDKWDEIIKELLEAVNNQKEFRKRLAGLHALSDVVYKEDWSRVKPIFEKLFNISFKGIDDTNDNVKFAAYGLLKTLKKITLRNGNIYTCTNMTELKEIYAIVLPLLLEKGIISHLNVVKIYSVTLLHEILETSKEESVIDKLKVKNSREDRQLSYTYNSKGKMREVLKPYLKDVIILIIESISDFESEEWNKVEQEVAAQKGASSNLDHQLNDMRIQSSKDSMLYDILRNCKDMLTEEGLDDTIPDLIKIIKKGVGISTRAGACNFIIETSIERPELFKLKFAKKVFRSCIEILANAKNCKESLLKIVCRLGGAIFRVLSKSFKTLQDSLDKINDRLCASVEKYDELIGVGIDKYWIAYLLIVREAIKNLKDLDLSQDRGAIVEQVIPYIFALKNNTLEDETKREQVAKLANGIFKDIFENRITIPVEAFEDEIMIHIKNLLDSSNFMVRTNGAAALADLCQHIEEHTFLQKLKERKIIELLVNKNMSGQYFTQYINNLRKILKFGIGGSKSRNAATSTEWLEDVVTKLYNKGCAQIAKSEADIEYRKAWIHLLVALLDYSPPKGSQNILDSREKFFNMLFEILGQNYEDGTSPAQENMEEENKEGATIGQLDSKNKDIRSVHRDILEFHQLIIESLAYNSSESALKQQFELYRKIYSTVSWEIRLGIVKNLDILFHQVWKYKTEIKTKVSENKTLEDFLVYLVDFTKENGEKFETNMEYIVKVLNTLALSIDRNSKMYSDIKAFLETTVNNN